MQNHHIQKINARLQRAGVASAENINWFAQVDSTNAWLLRQADSHARVCLAEYQRAGRGRRGRSWHAPYGSSVLMSIGWEMDATAAAGLSLVAGVAAIDALRARGISAVKLKWPNDILSVEKKSYGKKLGGILAETRGGIAVIGIGINVNIPHLPEGGMDLARLGFDGDRDALAAELMIELHNELPKFCLAGFAPFVEQWNRLNIHSNKLVELQLPDDADGEIIRARVIGADDDGALLINHNGIRRRILSATLRAADAAI